VGHLGALILPLGTNWPPSSFGRRRPASTALSFPSSTPIWRSVPAVCESLKAEPGIGRQGRFDWPAGMIGKMLMLSGPASV
jgi:hypothetical protein